MIITRSGATVLGLVIMASRAAVDHDWRLLRHCKDSVDIACWHIAHRSWGWW